MNILRRYRLRRIALQGVFFSACTLVLIGTGIALCNYLAGLPKERARFGKGFTADVRNGAEQVFRATAAALSAPEPEPLRSKLPVIELYLHGNRLDQLLSNPPESGFQSQPALLKAGTDLFEVQARLRGDSLNHWSFPYKSWRVKLGKSRLYSGLNSFNLYLPRSGSQISDYLGYRFAEIAGGLIVPQVELVHFRFNRKFDGLRLLLEQTGAGTPVRSGRLPGKIFKGDLDPKILYGRKKKRPNLFEEKNAKRWTVDDLPHDVGVADAQISVQPEIAKLVRIVAGGGTPTEKERALAEVIDLDAYARFVAYLDLITSAHVDNSHNQKLYLNPATGLLEPMVWDPFGFQSLADKRLDYSSNYLFHFLLQSPAFHFKKTAALWDLLKVSLPKQKVLAEIDAALERSAPEIRASVYKLAAEKNDVEILTNANWEQNVRRLREEISQRWDFLVERLTTSPVTVEQQTNGNFETLLNFETSGDAGAILSELKFENCEGDLTVSRENPAWIRKVSCASGKAALPIEEHLLTTFRPNGATQWPVKVVHTYRLAGKCNRVEPILRHPLTGVKLPFTTGPVGKEVGETLVSHTVEPTVFSGEVELKEPLVLKRGQQLLIRPGTTIRLHPGASVVVRGGALTAEGSAEHPIRFLRSGEMPFGALGIINSRAKLAHIHFEGGSYGYAGSAYFPAALSISGSEVSILNSELHGKISATDSSLNLENVTQIVSGVPIASQRTKVRAANVDVRPPSISINRSLLTGLVVGTPPRAEKEYKLTLSGFGDRRSKDLMLEISRAMEEAVADEGIWHAPKNVDRRYGLTPPAKARAYVDYYFDDEKQELLKRDASYRLRYRFKTARRFLKHLQSPEKTEFWPYRSEVQFKYGRQNLGDGLSAVNEARLELRKQSSPFSDRLLPPLSPWPASEMMEHVRSGRFFGVAHTPGRAAAEFLGEVSVEPKVVVVSARARQHVTLQTPFGSGPNPDQAFIITLDDAVSYGYPDIARCVETKACRPRDLPIRARIIELEIEFERNVSTKLDEQKKGKAELEKIDADFMRDQATIARVIRERLGKAGVKVEPSTGSKYKVALGETISSAGFPAGI